MLTPHARTALWIAIIAAAATSSLAMGIRQTFGLLLLPLAAEHAVAPWAFGLAVALHNLVGNALKYTNTGGSVTIRVDANEQQLLVAVADTGIGISAEDAARIFERFYRASDKRVERITGTGLGLTIAREVARLHGGDMTVESQLDQGSTFTLTLPVKAAA